MLPHQKSRPLRHARPGRHRPAHPRARQGDQALRKNDGRRQGLRRLNEVWRNHQHLRCRGRNRPNQAVARPDTRGIAGKSQRLPRRPNATAADGQRHQDRRYATVQTRPQRHRGRTQKTLHPPLQFIISEYEPPYAWFKVACTKGTYVRTLAHDLGQALGCGAHLAGLRRTVSGKFKVSDATQLEELTSLSPGDLAKRVIPMLQLSAATEP